MEWLSSNSVGLALIGSGLGIVVIAAWVAKKYADAGIVGVISALTWPIITFFFVCMAVFFLAIATLVLPPTFRWIGGRALKPAPIATATPAPSSGVCVPGSIYVVQKGDTLGSIAAKCGSTVAAIVAANSRLQANPNLIEPGWLIGIPVPSR